MIASHYTVHSTGETKTRHANTKSSLPRDIAWRRNIGSIRSYSTFAKEKISVPWRLLMPFLVKRTMSFALKSISTRELSTAAYNTLKLCRYAPYRATNHPSVFPDVTSAAVLPHRHLSHHIHLPLPLLSCHQYVLEHAQRNAFQLVLKHAAVRHHHLPQRQCTTPCHLQHSLLLQPVQDRVQVHVHQCVQ